LLRQERAIVSESHGTTRDYLEASVGIEGIPVRLFDTAGLRETRDALEAEGMRRAGEVVAAADLVLYLVDSAAGLAAVDRSFLSEHPAALGVWNKIDLHAARPAPDGFIPVSSLTGEGVDALERGIASRALGGSPEESGEPLIDSERQKDLIDRALASLRSFSGGMDSGVPLDLLAVDLAEALEALGEITGEVTSAEILERMFSSFCVGK
jgi:tRNA modification GTPase